METLKAENNQYDQLEQAQNLGQTSYNEQSAEPFSGQGEGASGSKTQLKLSESGFEEYLVHALNQSLQRKSKLLLTDPRRHQGPEV